MKSLLLPLLLSLLGLLRRAVDLLSDLLFPLYWGGHTPLPPIHNPLLLSSASSLARRIALGEVTSSEVVSAFIQRIKDVNPTINAVVDSRFSLALEEAARVDAELSELSEEDRRERCARQPFLGLPFTTKDCFPVRGLSWTTGLLARKGTKATEDSPTVAAMRRAGAIPLAVTNVSELCMWMESANTVYGRTANPYHTGRTPGGSSGGEGALICSAGSPCGIGSDVGGSIRMPAFFNGIYGHKPSSGIVDNGGGLPLAHGKVEDYLCTGPMARHSEDLLPMLRVLAEGKVDLLRLDTQVDVSRLRVFWMEDDGGFPLCSPVHRQLREAQQRLLNTLQEAHPGLTIQRADLPEFYHSLAIWSCAMADEKEAPSFASELRQGEGEVSPLTELAKWLFGLSPHTLPALVLALVEAGTNSQSDTHRDFLRRGEKLRKELDLLLGEDGVLVYPSHPTPAPYHGQPLVKHFNFAYTAIFNILGNPVTQLPLGIGQWGVPLGVQIVGGRRQDHLCLAVAGQVEKLMGGWTPPGAV